MRSRISEEDFFLSLDISKGRRDDFGTVLGASSRLRYAEIKAPNRNIQAFSSHCETREESVVRSASHELLVLLIFAESRSWKPPLPLSFMAAGQWSMGKTSR